MMCRRRAVLGRQSATLARFVAVAGLCLATLGWQAVGATAELRHVDPISDLMSSCLLQAFRLEAGLPEDVSIAESPEGDVVIDSESVRVGRLRLAGGEYTVGVSLSTAGVTLLADTDQNRELTAVPWDGMTDDERLIATVSFRIYDETDQDRAYPLLLLWDPFVPLVIAYCRGGYTVGTIELGGVGYLLAVVDDDTDGRYDDLATGTLLIDSDRDGELLATMDSHEQFALDEPFNLGGVTYAVSEVTSDGTSVVIEPSERFVAAKAPLIVGAVAPPFAGRTTDGSFVSLEALRGSVVLLDFWAGWCAPCVREFPGVQALHEAWSGHGLVVLGINLDRSEAAMGRAVEEHGLTYAQIYDDDDAISDLYRIAGIPMTYVLDRDGTIIARGLRGAELREAVESALNRDPDFDGDPGEVEPPAGGEGE